ncbi:MAG: hypothetical protein IR527_02400 [Bacteroides sp.]|nr:MAG: hypothetical protein IR527_02400 [Bacteroides sp.]
MSTLLLIIIIIITYIIQFEKNLITNYLMITILLSIYFFIKNAVLISFINIIITISTVTILTIINHYDINYFEVKNKYMIFKYLFIINIIAIYIYTKYF